MPYNDAVVEVWKQGKAIFIEADPRHREACRLLPGATFLPKYGVWRYPATAGVAGQIFMAFGEKAAVYDDHFRTLLRDWRAQVNRDHAGLVEWPGSVDLQPWQHQRDAYQYMQSALGDAGGAVGLFAGMGTGKTLTTIAVLAQRKWRRVLIVCPKNMVEEWADQITAHITDGSYKATPLIGPLKKRTDVLQDLFTSNLPFGRVFVTNYESTWQGQFGATIESYDWDCIVLDESQAIKSAGSKVSLFFSKMGRRTPYRIALTGTPVHDRILDVYGQYRFLDPGIFGTNFNRFMARYAITETVTTGSGKQFPRIVGYQNQEELSEKMYRIAFRVSEDVLSLPESVTVTRTFDLTPEGRKVYDEFERAQVLEIGNHSAVAGNVLTKLLRLQQIASGYLPLQDDTDPNAPVRYETVDTAKRDAFRDVLEEIDPTEPVVVFAKFRKDLEAIRNTVVASGRAFFEESGTLHQWRQFQDGGHGAGDVIGVQIDAGSAGIDLTRAAYCIFYTTGYSLGDFQQAQRRVLRPGQKRSVRYVHMVARNTVDQKIHAALRDKKAVAEYVVEELRSQWGQN